MSIDYLPWNQPTSAVARVCMRDGEAELTYAEVATRVDAVAEQFAAMGVGRGDGVSRSAVALKLQAAVTSGIQRSATVNARERSCWPPASDLGWGRRPKGGVSGAV
jgi:hypothetical protein